MTHMDIRQKAYSANIAIVEAGLVVLTWGNVSVANRQHGVIAIKPSGVSYADLSPETMVIVSMETGAVVEGEYHPSSDTPTHVLLYRHFDAIGGITHTHSRHATMFAQARREIPCLGTTHADHFHGSVPVTRSLTEDEVQADYEGNTGQVIVERFADLDPVAMPAAPIKKLAGH